MNRKIERLKDSLTIFFAQSSEGALRQHIASAFDPVPAQHESQGYITLKNKGTHVLLETTLSGTKDSPRCEVAKVCSRLDEEILGEIDKSLSEWGWNDVDNIHDLELSVAEESLYHGANPSELCINVAFRLASATAPICSRIVDFRVFDGYLTYEEHLGDAWYAPDMRSFCEQVFGFYRKDLAKMVANSNEQIVTWMIVCAPYLTQDQLVRVFQEISDNPSRKPCLEVLGCGVESLLSFFTHSTARYNIASRRYLPNDNEQEVAIHVRDSVDATRKIAKVESSPKKVNGWQSAIKELLDTRQTGAAGNIELFKPSVLSDYDEFKVYELSTPAQYCDAAKKLKNCLDRGAFLVNVAQGRIRHLVFEKNGKPFCVAEIRMKYMDDRLFVGTVLGVNNQEIKDERFNRDNLWQWLVKNYLPITERTKKNDS